MLALQAAGLAAIVTGVILVARAPCLSNLRPVASVPRLPVRHGPREPHGAGGRAARMGSVSTELAGSRQPVPSLRSPMGHGEWHQRLSAATAARLRQRLALVSLIL